MTDRQLELWASRYRKLRPYLFWNEYRNSVTWRNTPGNAQHPITFETFLNHVHGTRYTQTKRLTYDF
jgi:hypothetical protein